LHNLFSHVAALEKEARMQEVMYLHLLRLRKHECIHGGSMIIELWLDNAV